MTQTITIKDPQAPASLAQVNYLTSLIEKRDCPTVAERFAFAQSIGLLHKGAASKMIDQALASPMKKTPVKTIDQQVTEHDAALAAAKTVTAALDACPAFGYYEIDGTVYYWDVTGKDIAPQLRKLTKITQYGGAVKGSWKKVYAGYSAPSVAATYTPYAGKGWSKVETTKMIKIPAVLTAAVLAGAKPMSMEQAAQQGKMMGFCIRCGATLTDPESVAAGIGPVCKNYWF
jgi:hypothetical protein